LLFVLAHRALPPRALPSFPTRRSSDLVHLWQRQGHIIHRDCFYMERFLNSGVESRFCNRKAQHSHAILRNLNQLSACAFFVIREDRKSTRLNSSHVSISYAVFCLKKKK